MVTLQGGERAAFKWYACLYRVVESWWLDFLHDLVTRERGRKNRINKL
jgi:hypothetical protein